MPLGDHSPLLFPTAKHCQSSSRFSSLANGLQTFDHFNRSVAWIRALMSLDRFYRVRYREHY